jgi:REP element-mobilizing transposase RayT
VRAHLTSPSVLLESAQADVVITQLRMVAADRGWFIFACAVMSNHVHLVVGVNGDPDPANLLRDFKRSTSRALSRLAPEAPAHPWWTQSGSRRKLPGEPHVRAAVNYVMQQWHPLALYKDPDW